MCTSVCRTYPIIGSCVAVIVGCASEGGHSGVHDGVHPDAAGFAGDLLKPAPGQTDGE